MEQRRRRSSLPEQVLQSSKKEAERDDDPPFTEADLLSTGSTLLNLACSGTVKGALRKKKMVNFIGDSSSGKSLTALQCLIEALFSPHFKDHELYYDDIEGGCDFNIENMFGPEAASRAEDRLIMRSSADVEEWQDFMTDLAKRGVPFVYVLDSYDVLDSTQAKIQAVAEAKARAEGKEVSGSYGMDKVKRTRALFRPAIQAMKKTDSIVIIISQTQVKIGAQFKQKTRAAEDALEFHSYHCVWFSNLEDETQTVNGKKYVIGTNSKVMVKKNRLTGKRKREAIFTIFSDLGIDDVGSCVDYLTETTNHWDIQKKTIIATELGIEASRPKLIEEIESKRLRGKLQSVVRKVWLDIEQKLETHRRSRYEEY